MMQIDTSMYKRRPTGLESLSGLAAAYGGAKQSIRQNKLADLAIQQKQFQFEEMKRQKRLEEDLRKIEKAKNDEFLTQYQTAQMESGTDQLSPDVIQSIYSNVYPEQYAQQQMKNPMAMLEYQRKMENQRLAQERLDMQREEANRRLKKDAFMEDYRRKTLDWKAKDYDRGVYEFETSLAEKIRDQDWTEGAKDREQLQLLQKITPEIQKYKKKGKLLDAVEVRKINEGTSATGNLLSLTGELTRQVESKGLQKLKGADKAKMDSTVRSIATSLNNPMFVNSGVMSPGEFENMKAMVGDPTDWMMLSKAEVNARMAALQNFIKSKYVNSLEAYGIEGEKAYKAIRMKTNGFFNEKSSASILTEEDEGLIRR